jgi:hypothetical protein
MRRAAAATTILLLALSGCGSQAKTGERSPPSQAATETIPRADAPRAVVWAVGDAATPGAAPDRIAGLVRRAHPDLFLYLGDVYETGAPSEFRRWYQPRFGRLAGITMPTIGNHEWGNRFRGYYPYWFHHKGHRQPPWSKRTIAGWQAPHVAGSPQVKWLESTLTGARGDCRIAFWHRPRYSAGVVHGVAPDLNPLWNRLAGHARIVLSGHDHDLQRHRPQRGIAQYVVGAGGRGRYPLNRSNGTMVWGRDDVDAALRIVLTPGHALLEFRGARGHVLDRSRVACSPAS